MDDSEYRGQSDTGFRADEIDLIDIGTLFWRYRWLVTGVFLGIFLPAATAAFWLEDQFAVRTALEVGLITVDGEVQPVEPVDTVVAKLRNSYIPAELRQAVLPDGVTRNSLSVTVETRDKSNLVVLLSQSREPLLPIYQTIHSGIVARLVADHARVTNVIRSNLEKNLALAKIRLAELQDETTLQNRRAGIQASLVRERIELENLQDPKIFRVTRKNLENALAAAREKLTGLADRARYLDRELAALETSSELVQSQIGQTRAFLDRARESRPQMVKAVDGGSDAMTALLLDSEMQQSVERLARLEERLYSGIPTRRVELENQRQEVQRQQELQREEIALLESRLVKLDLEHARNIEQKRPQIEKLETELAVVNADHARQIQQQKASIRALEAQLENLRVTRPVTPPQISLKPVGLGTLAMLVLAVLVSGMLSVLSVFMVAFGKAVHERLRNEGETPVVQQEPRFPSRRHAA